MDVVSTAVLLAAAKQEHFTERPPHMHQPEGELPYKRATGVLRAIELIENDLTELWKTGGLDPELAMVLKLLEDEKIDQLLLGFYKA